MKNEIEIAEKYWVFQKIKDNASLTVHKEEVETTISVLLWVLSCNECNKYPCTCDDPF